MDEEIFMKRMMVTKRLVGSLIVCAALFLIVQFSYAQEAKDSDETTNALATESGHLGTPGPKDDANATVASVAPLTTRETATMPVPVTQETAEADQNDQQLANVSTDTSVQKEASVKHDVEPKGAGLRTNQVQTEMPAAPEVKPITQSEAQAAQTLSASAQAKSAQESEGGLHNLEEESGNWLLKRVALEGVIDKLDQINTLFTSVLDSRMDFLVKRNQVDRAFDLFANSIGFELGEADQLLNDILVDLGLNQKEEGDLAPDERELAQEVTDKKNAIEQLKKDIKNVTDLDASLDDVIMRSEEQVKICDNYKKQAWINFQAIKLTLDDEKAYELDYQTLILRENIKQILAYLTGDLLNYFNTSVQMLNDDMSKIKSAIENLKTQGVDLHAMKEKLALEDWELEKARLKAEEEANQQAFEEDTEQKTSKGWWRSISVIWQYPIQKIADLFSYFKSFFVSSKTVVNEQVNDQNPSADGSSTATVVADHADQEDAVEENENE